MPAAKPLDDVELEWGTAMHRAGVGNILIARTVEEHRQILRRRGAARRALEVSPEHVRQQLREHVAVLVDRQNGGPPKRGAGAPVADHRQDAGPQLDGSRTEPQARGS